MVLDHHSPVLHLVQMIRDEAHRFAVTFHRKRRQMRDRSTELLEIPGVGDSTTRRLLEHFGSVQAVKQADAAALSAVVTRSRPRPFSTTSASRMRRFSDGAQDDGVVGDETNELSCRGVRRRTAVRRLF